MADYCKCKACENIDPTITSNNGTRWYCEVYHTYEDPDKVKECKYYRQR
jgi:hypothetical protein